MTGGKRRKQAAQCWPDKRGLGRIFLFKSALISEPRARESDNVATVEGSENRGALDKPFFNRSIDPQIFSEHLLFAEDLSEDGINESYAQSWLHYFLMLGLGTKYLASLKMGW